MEGEKAGAAGMQWKFLGPTAVLTGDRVLDAEKIPQGHGDAHATIHAP